MISLLTDNSPTRTCDIVILSAIAMLREQQGQQDNAAQVIGINVYVFLIGRTDVKVLRFKLDMMQKNLVA